MSNAAAAVRIWDPAIRLFHWLLVVLVAFSWWSGEQHDMESHRLSGYAIVALLLFRLFWGLAGSRTARFAAFVRGPRVIAAYAKNLGRRDGDAPDGHNPIGGWSVVAMLLALTAMTVAGLFASDVDGLESGPLAAYISFEQSRLAAEVHEIAFNLILVLVALHVAAILFYLLWKRQNLVRPMIMGGRPAKEGEATADLRWSPARALFGMAIAVAAAWAISRGFQL